MKCHNQIWKEEILMNIARYNLIKRTNYRIHHNQQTRKTCAANRIEKNVKKAVILLIMKIVYT